MIGSRELRGVMAMMPSFATGDAADLRATNTVDVGNLATAVNRIVSDGIDVLATTGSFGEFHTLLPDEFETLVRTTIETVNKRVPVFVGATSTNSRETVARMRVALDAGADGVLLGVPYYFPSTLDNAVRFYREIGEMFPSLGIMIYHNPDLHRIFLPVEAFEELVTIPNLVAMKDSHRSTRGFIELEATVRGRISVFVHARQFYPLAELGAAGFWSIDCWMGPEPVIALRDAVARGDRDKALEIIRETTNVAEGSGPDLQWRETALKLAVGYAGYCDPGPLRPPFLTIPPEVQARMQARAKRWSKLREKYAASSIPAGARASL